MLNWIFLFLIGGAVLTAAFTGRMAEVTAASMASAKSAVDLAIGLAGQMALWLGFMGVLREAGLMRSLARGLEKVMVRLFPEVPRDHPAMGAMIMNLAANILGLGNAATPFGLKAMTELNKLNRYPGVSTNAMSLFLAINTSGVAVLPLGAVAIRATVGSKDPAGIIVPTLLATMGSTVTAVLVAKLLEKRRNYAPERFADPPDGGATPRDTATGAGTTGPGAPPPAATSEVKPAGADAKQAAVAADAKQAAAAPDAKQAAAMAEAEKAAAPVPPASGWRMWFGFAVLAAMVYALVRQFTGGALATEGAFGVTRSIFSDWLLPILMLAIAVFAFGRKVKIYEAFVSAAKEGFQISILIIPFLVAIIVAIGMFRASGAMDVLVGALAPLTTPLGFPPEALPMALIRPLSGSGAMAVMTETMKTYGPDSFVGYLVSILNGSMETTFYVLAVYFGSVQVKALRHTLIACLAADLAGIVGATFWCWVFFG